MKIILGSSSEFRKIVFSQISPEFESMSPDIDEKAIRSNDPEKLVLLIANAKADALEERIKEPSILVTSDQVVVFDGNVREKPESEEEAREFIRSYAHKPVDVVNGVVVTNTATGNRSEGIERATVSYNALLEDAVEEVLDNSSAMQCAGALITENPIMQKYEVSRTAEDDSFMGCPINLIKKLIDEVTSD